MYIVVLGVERKGLGGVGEAKFSEGGAHANSKQRTQYTDSHAHTDRQASSPVPRCESITAANNAVQQRNEKRKEISTPNNRRCMKSTWAEPTAPTHNDGKR